MLLFHWRALLPILYRSLRAIHQTSCHHLFRVVWELETGIKLVTWRWFRSIMIYRTLTHHLCRLVFSVKTKNATSVWMCPGCCDCSICWRCWWFLWLWCWEKGLFIDPHAIGLLTRSWCGWCLCEPTVKGRACTVSCTIWRKVLSWRLLTLDQVWQLSLSWTPWCLLCEPRLRFEFTDVAIYENSDEWREEWWLLGTRQATQAELRIR